MRRASAVRKLSERVILRLALSSSERSSHWTAAVWWALATSDMRWRARAQQRSLLMGFRLYAMALDPRIGEGEGRGITQNGCICMCCRKCYTEQISSVIHCNQGMEHMIVWLQRMKCNTLYILKYVPAGSYNGMWCFIPSSVCAFSSPSLLTNLIFFKRLLNLLLAGQQSDVSAYLYQHMYT